MACSATITQAVLEKFLTFLVPIFIEAMAGDDDGSARTAVLSMLDSYNPRTDRELRHAAMSVAFSFGALDCLTRATIPDLPVNQVIRLRGNANALNRAANQNESRLDKMQRQAVEAPRTGAEPEPDLPKTCHTDDLLAFVGQSVIAEPAPVVYASRQQRRHAERMAEKQRQRDARDMLAAERRARLANPVEGRRGRV